MTELHIMSSPEEAARALAEFIADLSEEAVSSRGRFRIALSGGITPRRLYQLLGSPPYAQRLTWDRWRIFWGDERCVPPDHPDSNYGMAKEALLDHVPVPPDQVYRMKGELPPGEAAAQYESQVLEEFQSHVPAFDLVLLGIGEDGHTASLFPSTPALEESHRLVVANWSAALQSHRITFTLPLINAARAIAFFDTGSSKADVLRAVLEPSPLEEPLPAALVRPASGNLQWFLTGEAARLLKGASV